jgi:hypothetical protein
MKWLAKIQAIPIIILGINSFKTERFLTNTQNTVSSVAQKIHYGCKDQLVHAVCANNRFYFRNHRNP